MKIRNPMFTGDGAIDCEVYHEKYGWLPFTAAHDDKEAHGREVYKAAMAIGPAKHKQTTQDDIDAAESIKIREHRNFLLAESDWTQLPDAPVDRAAWTVYRQALRDIPQQHGFPKAVKWPSM